MGIAVSLLTTLLVINACAYLLQPGMVFFPSSRLVATPSDWGLDYRSAVFDTEDGVELNGWFIPRESSRRVLLFFHGNAGNISHRGESVSIFHELGLNVFIIDYRGYGASKGKPSEAGIYRDARAAWRYLTAELGFGPENIIVFGRSLGGVVAAQLAAEANPSALILESSFSSAKDVARATMPVISRLLVLRFDLDAASHVSRAQCPVLILHSRDDEIIPYALGRKLFEVAPEPKRFVDLMGGHNQAFLLSQPAYEQALGDFIAAYAAGSG